MAAVTIKLELPPSTPQPAFRPPRDKDETRTLLERYWRLWNDPQTRPARQQLIAWFIENRADTCLNDRRIAFVNPDDKTEYAPLRQLWLKQADAHKHDRCFLGKAGLALSLTDRETAATWLKQNSWNKPYLGDLYANALAGITGMTPQSGATSFDPKVAQSLFAKSTQEEIMKDPNLAGP